mmetsp:Transcript_2916/g.8523  ORF Transcript_2916/g.8523 Transcript_2916/m.8523 type:complete len:163 (-) Transcript_2916:657-1145(-)
MLLRSPLQDGQQSPLFRCHQRWQQQQPRPGAGNLRWTVYRPFATVHVSHAHIQGVSSPDVACLRRGRQRSANGGSMYQAAAAVTVEIISQPHSFIKANTIASAVSVSIVGCGEKGIVARTPLASSSAPDATGHCQPSVSPRTAQPHQGFCQPVNSAKRNKRN